MTDINTTNTVQTTTAAANSGGGSATQDTGSTGDSITSDFDMFLQLLTAQLENQDPLDPADPTEFVAQLATFSSVEQQISTNDKLDQLIESFTAQDLTDAASLIGLSAEVEGGATEFDGEPVSFRTEGNIQANGATLTIESADGAFAASYTLSGDAETFEWDGTLADGDVAEPGLYSAQIEYFRDGESVGTEAAKAYVTISEVRPSTDGYSVVFEDGSVRSTDELTGLSS
ncbi:MAG: flagellar hook capping FlgD N-terminal domain-containing protein [Pseudomonadota bacterium]